MRGAHEIDCYAASICDASELRSLNDLASNLEIMENQLDYYFPEPSAEFESDEWQDILALLSSSTDWINEMTLEIDLQFDSDRLSCLLRELAQTYRDSIPWVIAARFGQKPKAAATSQRGRLVGKPEPRREHRYELLEPAI